MNDIRNLANLGKSFMEQHNCKYCHKTASHYVTYKESFAFLCSLKECSHKFDIQTGFFETGLEIKTTGE
jgi:hypothetical protein